MSTLRIVTRASHSQTYLHWLRKYSHRAGYRRNDPAQPGIALGLKRRSKPSSQRHDRAFGRWTAMNKYTARVARPAFDGVRRALAGARQAAVLAQVSTTWCGGLIAQI